MADIDRITELTLKYKLDALNPAEREELEAWLNESPLNRERFEERIKGSRTAEGIAAVEGAGKSKITARRDVEYPEGTTGQAEIRRLPAARRLLGAAAAILVIAAGIVAYFQGGQPHSIPKPAQEPTADIAPGSDKAVLTLADGNKVALDSSVPHDIALQGNSRVVKTGNGELAYLPSGQRATGGVNTVATPIGGKYKVTLPDGSAAWLNAASSLKYPTSFAGADRTVEMTGEVYFEVAHDPLRPFRVKSGIATVSVLGTHFDINAYADEPAARATLLSGSIRLEKGGQKVLLAPGDQARLAGASVRIVHGVDTSDAVAWKDGKFVFEHADIQAVMRELARWYSVDVRYESAAPGNRITAVLGRDKYLSNVLQVLEASGYHFKVIGGKTLVVLP